MTNSSGFALGEQARIKGSSETQAKKEKLIGG